MAAYGILLLAVLLVGGFLACIPAGAASVIQLEGQTVQIENVSYGDLNQKE